MPARGIDVTEPGYITVPIHKGCILVLTHQEYLRALKRGKHQRRREVNDRRQQGEGSLVEMLNPENKDREQQNGGHNAQKK